jgi:membrane protease YdiL (CAAX protease family)
VRRADTPAPPARAPRPALALTLTLVVLAASNVVANLLLPSGGYVPWNLAVAATLVGIARRIGGRDAADLGLARHQLGSGLRWGAAIGGAIAAVILLAALIPVTRSWFEDDAGRTGIGGLALAVLVTIPLGTVVMEEVAFRGCLPALLDLRPGWATRRSDLAGAALFGLWHVLPSLELGDRNETMGSRLGGQWGPVAVAVLATSVAGFALAWLRRRSDSVVAPMLAHYALNAAATIAAWLVVG